MNNQLEANKAIVTRFNKEFIERGDINVFYELVDANVINHTAPAGVSKSADGMIQVINMFRKAFPDLVVEVYEQVAEGDMVATHNAFHGTHLGEFMGIPATGKKVIIQVMDFIRLCNGKYVEHWGMRDIQNVLEQLK